MYLNMLQSLRILSCILILISNVASFVPTGSSLFMSSVPKYSVSNENVQMIQSPQNNMISATRLFAKKEPTEVEYGKGAFDPLRWISPLNPYMLFVYMFVFIFMVPVLKDAGILK